MAKKQIVWSSKAQLELKGILDFYTARNRSNTFSLKLLKKVEDHIRAIQNNEFIGRETSNKHYRILVLDVFLIFYRTHNETIEILSFWDNRQNPKNRIDYNLTSP